MIRHTLAAGLATASLLVAAPAGAFLFVDAFLSTQILQLPAGGVDSAFDIAAAVALGDEREIEIMRTDGNGSVGLFINPTGTDRLFSSSSAPGTEAGWIVVWDGPDGSPDLDSDGLGGIDLTQGGVNTGFLIRIFTDLPGSLEFTVTGVSGGSTSASLALPGTDTALENRFLAFSEFGTPALFAEAGSITMVLTGAAGLDAEIDHVMVTVPEPRGAAIVAALTLLGLVCRRHPIRMSS